MANGENETLDALIVGGGLSGLYALYKLRDRGFNVKGVEKADDVGGTWYWNRYPGCQCDIQSLDYSYSFDRNLELSWAWAGKYATQPEILRYIEHVADRHQLRPLITFGTTVTAAQWDDDGHLWTVSTSTGITYNCRFLIMATGSLSEPKSSEIDNLDNFQGDVYYTARWPHEGVNLKGKRVGVVGTGSSGVQVIPEVAKEADEVIVFQRTAAYSFPARNGPVPKKLKEEFDKGIDEFREKRRWSRAGFLFDSVAQGVLQATAKERNEVFESKWKEGDIFGAIFYYQDVVASQVANDILAEFVRDKIRSVVKDPETAEALCPRSFPIGTKRPCLDSNYYETYNLPHVSLVDLSKTPLLHATENAIVTTYREYDLDVLVLATGFDALTGALRAIDIVGRDGASLRQTWTDDVQSYLGLMVHGFPNLFTVTGPGSPSVLSNMMVAIEQHIEWISNTLVYLRSEELDFIEPTVRAQEGWKTHTDDYANLTLLPKAKSWYMGNNVPGKPHKSLLPYIGGVDVYRAICDEVVERDYLGFILKSVNGIKRCNDGVVRELRPDVALVTKAMVDKIPSLESISSTELREITIASAKKRPPGPEVGVVRDGTYPCADGTLLPWRLWMPASCSSPPPLVIYFHGSGWTCGSATSDEPLCRTLCSLSDAAILSFDYRHAPEHRFPAAHDDARTAMQWAVANAKELGVRDDSFVIVGLSAGANLAVDACQSDVEICGLLLVVPFVDCDFERPSYKLDVAGMSHKVIRHFWQLYADESEWTHPRLSLLRTDNMAKLPDTMVVSAAFDPVSDEGNAYVQALRDVGVKVEHVIARGHTHISVQLVGIVPSAAEVHAQMADGIRRFFKK